MNPIGLAQLHDWLQEIHVDQMNGRWTGQGRSDQVLPAPIDLPNYYLSLYLGYVDDET